MKNRIAEILTSREFWVTLVTLVVLLVSQIFPGFQLPVENLVTLILIVVAYLIGIAVDPGPGGWKGVIQSRKFWAAAIGIVLTFLDAFHVVLPADLTPEFLVSIAVLLGGLIANFAIQGPPPLADRDLVRAVIYGGKTEATLDDTPGEK